jgi:hypothetical protein
MYGLPVNFDMSVFVGKKLDLICYSANTINLSFENKTSITIMNSFMHQTSSDEMSQKQSIPLRTSDLVCLSGTAVDSAKGGQDGSLVLYFENGHILTIFDDSREYESYVIRIGNKEIIV